MAGPIGQKFPSTVLTSLFTPSVLSTQQVVTNVLQMCPSADILQLLTDEGFNNNCACGTHKPADIKHTHQEELYRARLYITMVVALN